MKPKLSKGKLFLLALLALVAVKFVFFRAPSEARIITDFRENTADFEQLRQMLAQDNIRSIGPDWVEAKYKKVPIDAETSSLIELPLNVSKNRLALYRSRMKALGIFRIDVDQFKHRIRLLRFGGGFTDTSWGIGYAWSKDAPKPLVKSAYHEMPGQNKTHFTRIEGDWYIYHSR